MRTALERAAEIEKAARERAWLEVETLLEAASEGLNEIRGASSNGDGSLAQSIRRTLDGERNKIREHRGVQPKIRDPDGRAGESRDEGLTTQLREERAKDGAG